MPNDSEFFSPLVTDREAADFGVDPGSGAKVIRMTSAAAWSHNIYCEQPYGSPDGQRFLIARAYDQFATSRQLFVADLRTRHLTLVEPDLPTEGVAHSSWSEWVYYVMQDGGLRRLSLVTLEREQICPAGSLRTPPDAYLESITPDGLWIVGYEKVGKPGAPEFAPALRTFAFNTKTRQSRTLCDSPDNLNPHAQVEHTSGKKWLYQLIRESTPRGVKIFAADLEGGEPAQLPIGEPWSADSSGHMAWIGGTGQVACAVNWLRDDKRHDPRHPEGNLLTAGPGDESPIAFPAPAHGFYHVCVSRCGRYFVADDFMDFKTDAFVSGPPGPIRIVVGNLQTGKSRVLINDCQGYGIAGSSRYEPDPYFTADNGHVIYNASPFGITQVFAAEVPTEFLKSLD